jgi:hypothetical protein
VVLTVFLEAEWVGFYIFRLWTYNLKPILVLPDFLPPLQVFFGYMILGNLFLTFVPEQSYKHQYYLEVLSRLKEIYGLGD